jgi:hypothetical protein
MTGKLQADERKVKKMLIINFYKKRKEAEARASARAETF